MAARARSIGIRFLSYPGSGFDVLKAKGLDLIKEQSVINRNETVIFLLDDAQERYDESEFWTSLIRGTPFWLPANVRFVISVTHFNARNLATHVDFLISSPKLTTSDLRLDEKEFEELVSSPVGLPPHWRSKTLENVILEDCGRLIGPVALSFDLIKSAFSKEDPIPSETALLKYFFSKDFTSGMAQCIESSDSYPMTPELEETIIECLIGSSPYHATLLIEKDRPCFDYFVKGGLLELVYYTDAFGFASPLAKRYFVNHFLPNRSLLEVLPESPTSLIMDAISLLSSSRLRDSTATYSGSFPSETVFKNLLLRNVAKLTPPSCSICPDLSKVFPGPETEPSTGVFDLYLNGGLSWGIEMRLNESETGEPPDRFSAQGAYASLNVTDCVVVDFRVGKVSKEVARDPKRMTVFFSLKDFSECTCICGMDEDPVVLQLAP